MPARANDSVQHFVLTFFSDQLLEQRHNLIPAHHHRLHFILGEIAVGFFCQRIRVQGLQFLQQLPVAAHQVLGIFRFLVEAKRAAEINPPNLPILTDQHVGEIGIGIGDQLIEDPNLVHLIVPSIRIRRLLCFACGGPPHPSSPATTN